MVPLATVPPPSFCDRLLDFRVYPVVSGHPFTTVHNGTHALATDYLDLRYNHQGSLVTGHGPTRGPGQEVCKLSWVESGRVR